MRNDFFDQSENSRPRIGDQAPAFRSVTAHGTIYFPADYFGKWVILFSYPADYNPLATSEFKAFTSIHDDFKSINCELVGLSVDRQFSHTPNLRSIKEKIEYIGIKDIGIKFPLIEDNPMEIAGKYGMIQPDKNNSAVARAVFFIDPECMIRAIIYYPLSLDLSFDELKRVIVALQTEEKAISPLAKSSGIAKEHIVTKKVDKKGNEWFLCTRELSEEKLMNVN